MKRRVIFYTVATNVYVEYWMAMVKSFISEAKVPDEIRVSFVVFTDRSEDTKSFGSDSEISDSVEITSVEIGNLLWPQASMERYELMRSRSADDTSTWKFWIDADMLFGENFETHWSALLDNSKLKFVQHPGFYRKFPIFELLLMYLRQPGLFASDAANYFKNGALGTWENRAAHASFVPRANRQNYVAGGFWGGGVEDFNKLLADITRISEGEAKSGRIPIWHDESYLNWWFSFFGANSILLDPRFCWTDTAIYLANFPQAIIAVSKKNHQRVWGN